MPEVPSLRRRLIGAVRVAVAIGLVTFLAWRSGITGLAGMEFDGRLVMAAFALMPLCLLIRAYNHALLLNRHSPVLTLSQTFALTLAGVGINLVVPTGAADLVKAHWGWRMHGNPEAMVISSVLDKLTSLSGLAAIAFAGALATGVPGLAAGAAVLLGLSLLPLLAPRWIPWKVALRFLAPGAEVDAAAVELNARPPVTLLAKVYAVSAAAWVGTFTVMWLCYRAVGAEVGLVEVLAIGPLSSLARLIPVSAGGIGVGEVTMAALLGRAGVPADVAALGVLLSMAVLVIAPGAAGALVLARGRKR